uniref:DEAH-box helicase 32 (putative) n=1 Tax=Hucho hucho TaxID=62062 RepID=A0A4W5LMN2_9TELE
MMSDPMLEHYGAIVIDQAHERTVSTDILLGLLQDILVHRPDLRVVILTVSSMTDRLLAHYDPEGLMQSLEELDYLAALDDDGNLSEIGIIISELPLDAQMAKALLVSCEFDCVNEVVTIAAMLSGM